MRTPNLALGGPALGLFTGSGALHPLLYLVHCLSSFKGHKFAIASLRHLLAPRYKLGPLVIEIIPRRATAGTGGQGVSHFRAHEGCKLVLGFFSGLGFRG